MKTRLSYIYFAGLLTAAPLIQAAPPSFTSHYVAGVEGLKAPSLPPPGIYGLNYHIFYTADRLNASNGSRVPVNFDATVYANVLRGLWMSDIQIFGGNLGADVVVPLVQTELKINNSRSSTFGLGDINVEPLILSWHGNQWDAAVGYSLWMPTGDSKPGTSKPGKGFWGHQISAGGTVYFDQAKSWYASVLNRYEINHKEKTSHITPGDQWTLEFGLGKGITKTIEIGVVGYYQKQVTSDSGAGASTTKDDVVAVGPEVKVFWPQIGLFTSLRSNWELRARDRAQGQTTALTLIKPF